MPPTALKGGGPDASGDASGDDAASGISSEPSGVASPPAGVATGGARKIDSISTRDYPVVQGVTLVMATIFVVVSMLTDVMYAVLDPRLRRRSG